MSSERDRREAAERLKARYEREDEGWGLGQIWHRQSREDSHTSIIWGAGLIVVGGGVSLGTYAAVGGGGAFLVLWGPAIYGAYRLIKGVAGNASPTYRIAGLAVPVFLAIIALAVLSTADRDVGLIEVGDCLDADGQIVSCDVRRVRFIVSSVYDVSYQGQYPGESFFRDQANRRCSTLATTYTSPSRESWDAGDRRIACAKPE